MNRFKTLISVSFVFSFIFTLTFLLVSHPTSTQAVSLENFDAGYIISDYQMSNYTSMTVEEIQSFLDSKNSCSKSAKSGLNPHYYLDNKLTQEISSDQLSTVSDYYIYSEYWSNSLGKYISVIHHIRDGKFVCLNNELFTTTDEYGTGRTAAEIIYEASQTYQINPQVLLVLLEKEQGLITDAWPNNIQYRSATGYGCPDTAACSSKYYGLENQVKNAAALFRTVLDGGWTNYPLGDNYIQYNPNKDCGGSTVNVKNLATSALYRYTPYQPNAATIAAGYGSGITCGAYGNRNFYLYFNDWFGNSTAEKTVEVISETTPTLTLQEIQANIVAPTKEASDLDFTYDTHIANYGWVGEVSAGEMSGTIGYSIPVESFIIKSDTLHLKYRAHVQNIGWMDWQNINEEIGTTGQSLRLEALEIQLQDSDAQKYDIYYRVHVEDYGWMDWVKNGETAGTVGESKRIEAIQVKITKKSIPTLSSVSYSTHVQNIGWQDSVENGTLAGTTGQSLRLEAIKISLPEDFDSSDIQYRVHVQNIGWMDWVDGGALAGTTGQSLRLEAIEIKLSDELSQYYDIQYRVHVHNIGWMDWVDGGALAGTTGQSLRLEAIEIKIKNR